MSYSLPYIYYQTISQIVVFSPLNPANHTITDLFLSIHSKDSGILAIDFYKEIDYPNVKIEPISIDLKDQIQNFDIELLDENNKHLNELPQWISKKTVKQIIIPKNEQEFWSQLELPDKNFDKLALKNRRSAALERRSEWEKVEREELRKKKTLEEKRLFEKQWDMEKERRNEIERQKKVEDLEMRKDLVDFSNKVETVTESEHIETNQSVSKVTFDAKLHHNEINTEIFDIPKDSSVKEKTSFINKNQGKKMIEKLGNLYPDIPTRQTAPPVKISFTPRILRSAARQDKDAEIMKKFEIWKRKNKPDRLEENPTWIKQKGDKFFEREDYLAAINAYTAALNIDPDFLLCYANRAACYLKRSEFSKCIDDCNRFLITKPDETSASSQDREKILKATIKVLARRGTAYFNIGEREKAIRDYELSIQMSEGKDPSLELDYKKLLNDEREYQSKIEKQLADTAFLEERYQDAIELYTQLINKRKDVLICRSNRSACYMKIGSLQKGIIDSTFVIDSINEEFRNAPLDKASISSRNPDSIDDLSESKKRNILIKAYARRGTCNCLIGKFQDGYADYNSASRLAPEDEALLRDMDKINLRLQSQIHPDWYKNRGNHFFTQNEYETAIECYTLAIHADDTNPVYYSNRAQCHLKLKLWLECVKDIDSAFNARIPEWYIKKHEAAIEKKGGIEKVTEVDAIPANPYLTPDLQLKLYVRRATCYKALDEIHQAMQDYKNALKFDPNNRLVKEEIKEIEPLYQKYLENKAKEAETKTSETTETASELTASELTD